jgi:hypothetical protein
MIRERDETAASTPLNKGEELGVVMVLGYLYVLLCVFDDLFGEVVVKTR